VGAGQYPWSKLSARSMDCLTCSCFRTGSSRQLRAPTEAVFSLRPTPAPSNPNPCSPATLSISPPIPPPPSPAPIFRVSLRALSSITRHWINHDCQFHPTRSSARRHGMNDSVAGTVEHRDNSTWSTVVTRSSDPVYENDRGREAADTVWMGVQSSCV
jgi:hypothetical protein